MASPTRRKQVSEAFARLSAKRKEAGLVRRSVWAHPNDWAKIRVLEKALAEKRKEGYITNMRSGRTGEGTAKC